MNNHHFDRMSEVLVKSGVVPEDRRAEAEAALKLAWRGEIALSWSVDDVQEVCPGLTEEEAEEVLEQVLRKHDATVGVNWDAIRAHGLDLYGERALEDLDGAGEAGAHAPLTAGLSPVAFLLLRHLSGSGANQDLHGETEDANCCRMNLLADTDKA